MVDLLNKVNLCHFEFKAMGDDDKVVVESVDQAAANRIFKLFELVFLLEVMRGCPT